MISQFQVYGERCSGTNYIIRLLERNLTSAKFTELFGFKHWFVDDSLTLPDDVLGIVVTRNSYDSLRSLHEKQWHTHPSLRGLPLEDFLQTEWHCIWDDEFWGVDECDPRWKKEMAHERDPRTGERFENVCRMLEAKFRNWKALMKRSKNAFHVDYDVARRDPEQFLQEISSTFGIKTTYDFVPVNGYKGLTDRAYLPKVYPRLSAEEVSLIDPVELTRYRSFKSIERAFQQSA